MRFLSHHPEVSLVGSAAIAIDTSGNTLRNIVVPTDSSEIAECLEFSNPKIHPSWMVRREVFDRLRYRRFPAAQDYDFLLRCLDEGFCLSNIGIPLLKYRIREDSITRNKSCLQLKCSILAFILHKERVNKGYETTVLQEKDYTPSTKEMKVMLVLSRVSEKRSKNKVGPSDSCTPCV